jgi:hypothetical protein
MAELTLEQLLTAMKRRQPLPPEIRQDIIEGASKVGSFLWEGSGPGIAMGMAKMRMEDPDLSLSDMFPAVVGAGVLRGGGKFRPRVVQGGFSNLDDAQKFALTAERQSVRKQTLSEIFEARKAKEAQLGEIPRSTKPSTLRKPTREQLSELPKEEQDRILKAFDEGRIEEVKIQGQIKETIEDIRGLFTETGDVLTDAMVSFKARLLGDEKRLAGKVARNVFPQTRDAVARIKELGKQLDNKNLGATREFLGEALDDLVKNQSRGIIKPGPATLEHLQDIIKKFEGRLK